MKDVRAISEFSKQGIYMLLLFASEEITLTIGKMGKRTFPKGYYTYTGSALGRGATSIKHRIARHLRKEKQKFWHIDYFLGHEKVSVRAIIVIETNKMIECNLNRRIMDIRGTEVPIKGFGASDCRKNCESHLLYFPRIKNKKFLIQKLVRRLQSVSGNVSFYLVH